MNLSASTVSLELKATVLLSSSTSLPPQLQIMARTVPLESPPCDSGKPSGYPLAFNFLPMRCTSSQVSGRFSPSSAIRSVRKASGPVMKYHGKAR